MNTRRKYNKRKYNSRTQLKARAFKNRIEKMKKDLKEAKIDLSENKKTIFLLITGQYKVDNVSITKLVGKNKKEVTEVVTLYGKDAILHTLKEHKIKYLIISNTYCIVEVDNKDVEKVLEIMKPMGKVQVNNYTPKTIEHTKKPTNNTIEVRKAAKEARKAKNISIFKNRKPKIKIITLANKKPKGLEKKIRINKAA